MRKKIMIIISLLVLSSFSLVGCEEKKEPTADEIAKAFEKREDENKPKRVQGGSPKNVNTDFIREAEKEYLQEQNKR
ncbi:hypothetical protein [uncultured Desulfovibrio sp.]|uniref:hypothetical protein n=1 Tax=uncultured Desulfovibrio sp. TaxID=167968 RepID=UPI0026359883|nr:hypothetical protein [uncultured Desulfovibrio sp.]